jgi:hypothetical protein
MKENNSCQVWSPIDFVYKTDGENNELKAEGGKSIRQIRCV